MDSFSYETWQSQAQALGVKNMKENNELRWETFSAGKRVGRYISLIHDTARYMRQSAGTTLGCATAGEGQDQLHHHPLPLPWVAEGGKWGSALLRGRHGRESLGVTRRKSLSYPLPTVVIGRAGLVHCLGKTVETVLVPVEWVWKSWPEGRRTSPAPSCLLPWVS